MAQLLREFFELKDMVESPNAERVTLLIREPHLRDPRCIQVHKGILFKRWPRIALHCERIHADTVDLTAERPGVIKDYVTILHTGHVSDLRYAPGDSSSMSNVAKSRYNRLSALYIFCGQSEDTISSKIVFCAILDLFHHKWPDGARYFPGSDVINNIYGSCLPVEPLRQFLAECYIDFAKDGLVLPEEQYNSEFMKNVLMGVLTRRDLPKYLSRTINPREFIEMKEPEMPTTKFTRSGRKALKRRRASM
ncbi:hypothetical protein G6011_10495 [Alternaria panax]|uniref:Uncharacterized protein n=1 Tax=Alternaria panax TaxID=48097 RepID=A0AAD4IC43_9PLEO|nr:hypothetical protein G6011_10495 [Alternaria panax]